jgi:hypothetical protein
MISLFGKDIPPEDKVSIFVDAYLQKACKDNESITVTSNDARGTLFIEYNTIRDKKVLMNTFQIPFWLAVDLSEKTITAIIEDLLVKARGK